MKRKGKKFRFRDEEGQTLVEAALTIPLFILILCGIIDFGWIFSNQLMLNNASREGARYAVVNSNSGSLTTIVTQKVRDSATIGTGDELSVTVTKSANGDIKVVVSKNVKILTPLTGIFVDGETVLVDSTTVMNSN